MNEQACSSYVGDEEEDQTIHSKYNYLPRDGVETLLAKTWDEIRLISKTKTKTSGDLVKYYEALKVALSPIFERKKELENRLRQMTKFLRQYFNLLNGDQTRRSIMRQATALNQSQQQMRDISFAVQEQKDDLLFLDHEFGKMLNDCYVHVYSRAKEFATDEKHNPLAEMKRIFEVMRLKKGQNAALEESKRTDRDRELSEVIKFVKENFDSALEESKRTDRARQRQETEEQLQRDRNLQQLREAREAAIPPEPTEGVMIRFRFPGGTSLTRCFSTTMPMDVMVNVAGSKPGATREFYFRLPGSSHSLQASTLTGSLSENDIRSSTVFDIQWEEDNDDQPLQDERKQTKIDDYLQRDGGKQLISNASNAAQLANLNRQRLQLPSQTPSYYEQQQEQAAANEPPPDSESPTTLEVDTHAEDVNCSCNCHRKPLKRNKYARNRQVLENGSEPGGSSDNPSDSNDDNKENKQRPGRLGRDKKKPKSKKGYHRRPSKRKQTNDKERGQERHHMKEDSGDIPDAHSSGLKQAFTINGGGDHGGSSDYPSDSNEDDKKNKQKRHVRKGRDKGKPKLKRGDVSDSNSSSMTDNSADEQNSMHRKETHVKRKRNNTKGRGDRNTSPDLLDGSEDTKTKWIIDSAGWKTCIRRNNTHLINVLLSKKKIPDNDLLNKAYTVFEKHFIGLICDGICRYIVQKSSHVIHVYPAINELTHENEVRTITFVVILQGDADLGNEFQYHIKHTNVRNDENVEIKKLEKRRREKCVVGDDIGPDLTVLSKCIQKHDKSLRKNHTNVCRISHSRYKSIRFGKNDWRKEQISCITLYVYVKGLIPLGEELLPTELDVDGCQVLVDVREGFVEAYTGNLGPNDTLDHLQMGCSIGVVTHHNENPVIGTLGGIFEFADADFCMCSAHAVLTANEMKLLERQKVSELKGINCAKHVYQPYNNYLKPFGRCRTAVYKEGGNGVIGVDVASIEIKNRNPITGEFPMSDSRGLKTDKKYTSGKVFTCEEIHNALEHDSNRLFYKYGCGTGWTTGILRSECGSFCAPHPVQDGNIDFEICLHNQFEIYSETDDDFAGKSDSGALVFMEDKGELVAVGIVMAGMAEDVCFVTPLNEILKTLRLDPNKGLKDFTNAREKECRCRINRT